MDGDGSRRAKGRKNIVLKWIALRKWKKEVTAEDIKKKEVKKESGEWNPQIQIPDGECVVVPWQKTHGDYGHAARFKTLRHMRSLRFLRLNEAGPLYAKLLELAERYDENDKELAAVIAAIRGLEPKKPEPKKAGK
jgi:hypothetical protein